MGSGKSYIGKKLAYLLSKEFYDLDTAIENDTNLTISQIIHKHGEPYFRKLESQYLLYSDFSGIIATGGGIIENQYNVIFLKKQFCVWLSPPWDIMYYRIQNSSRPLVKGKSEQQLRQLFHDRNKLYRTCANLKFTGNDPNTLAKML